MKNRECSKCGSKQLITEAKVVDHGHYDHQRELAVIAHRKPEALFFKQAVSHRLRATICAKCGFTELYTEDPRTLYEVIEEAKLR